MKELVIVTTLLMLVLLAGCQAGPADGQGENGNLDLATGKRDGNQPAPAAISTFEECVAAGNPIMESYPAQCKTSDGQTFTQTVPEWKTDGVTLMRIPESGTLACFGCGATQCIDPLPTLEMVEETEEQHCNSQFEVVEPGAASSTSSGMPLPSNEPVDNEMIVSAGMPVPSENFTEEMVVVS